MFRKYLWRPMSPLDLMVNETIRIVNADSSGDIPNIVFSGATLKRNPTIYPGTALEPVCAMIYITGSPFENIICHPLKDKRVSLEEYDPEWELPRRYSVSRDEQITSITYLFDLLSEYMEFSIHRLNIKEPCFKFPTAVHQIGLMDRLSREVVRA